MVSAVHGIARIALPVALALTCLATSAQEKVPKAKFEPPEGKCLVLIGADWHDEIKTYTKLTSDVPAGSKFYYEFNGDTSFFWHNARANAGPDGVLAIEFNMFSDTKGSLKPFLSGERDENIMKVGRAIKEWGRPTFVAIGSEFDHKTHFNRSYTPEEFVRAYRHVHDLWAREGVENVAYVWHSVCDDVGEAIWRYYPGDEYVDWFGFSVLYAHQARQAPKFAAMARSRRKPLACIESGSINGQAQRWEDWHAPFLGLCRDLDVKLIGYNNWGKGDTPFDNNAFDRLPKPIGVAWGKAMKSPTYLHASPELVEVLKGGANVGGRVVAKPEADLAQAVGPVDLLGRIDPKRDAVEGDWRQSNQVLTFAGDKEWSRIQIPYHPPEEYDLTVVAERVRGIEILILGLVVGGKQATVVLDGWGGGVSGLEKIDGKVSQGNETTHRGWRFVNGKPTTIVCKVRKSGVAVTCDGRQIIDWRGEADRLSIVGGWKVPDEGQFFLGGWKGGAFRFKQLAVREVSKGGVAAPRASTPRSGGKLCPPKGKRLLIIGQDRDSMTAYVRDTGQVPGGFMSYNHLQAFDGLMGIGPRYIDGLHDFNIVKEYPNTTLQIGLVFKGMEKEIARGDHDDRLDRLAGWFKEADVPIYLRVGPEFDLPADNGFGWPTYEPEPYKLAFRHVVDRFRKTGADNVAFVWHSAAWKGVEKVWASYPGDDYVDWFAISLFGRENNEGAALFARYARQRGKPLMIAEATPLGGLAGTKDGVHTWEGWFRPFFEYIEKNDVRVVCFIPVDWESIKTYRGKGWRDARVQVVPEIKKRWLDEVGQAKYLKASPGLFEALGHRRRDVLRPDKSASLFDPTRASSPSLGTYLGSGWMQIRSYPSLCSGAL